MLIKKLSLTSDSDRITVELNQILVNAPWLVKNQIGLRYRDGATTTWYDSAGGLYENGVYVSVESDFVNWCIDSSYYVRQEVERLENTLNIKTGRIRFMRLMPRTGLSIHSDSEPRYHLVLKTNKYAQFGFAAENMKHIDSDLDIAGTVYNIPKDNHWYFLQTTNKHWVYNGGDEERIHLVVCAA